MEQEIDKLGYSIIDTMLQKQIPVGANMLSIKLEVPPATIGRNLLTLEAKGYIQKVSNKGRILTPKGIAAYQKFFHKQMIQESTTLLIQSVSADDLEHLCNVLDTRIIIEKETARLAAQNMTPLDLKNLNTLIIKQKEQIKAGKLGEEEDLTFHEYIAKLSQNDVFENIIKLILTNRNVYRELSYIHYKLVKYPDFAHDPILEAFERKDGKQASDAMCEHLKKLKEAIISVKSDQTSLHP